MRNLTLAFTLLVASGAVYSEIKGPTFNQFNVGYSVYEDSEFPQLESRGINWDITYEFTENVFFGVSRFTQESTADLVSSFNFTFEDYSLGYIFDVSPRASVYVIGTSTKLVTKNYAFINPAFESKAKSAGAGFRFRVNDNFELGVEAKQAEYEFLSDPDNTQSETEGSAYVTYFLDEGFSAGLLYTTRLEEDYYGLQLRFGF
ncbi:MAG: hypothetical protein V2I33_10365 [Kangiellaceae bacterium]|jgi:hypothetical protein|nr:hypothetical protein [Kangiellaceae bacterium]